MKETKVSIVLRVRNANGSRSHYTAVKGGNGRLRPQVGLVSGKPKHLPTGTYYLRYRHGTKRVWEAVGVDPVVAATAQRARSHALEGLRLHAGAPAHASKAETQAAMAASALRSNLAFEVAVRNYLLRAVTQPLAIVGRSTPKLPTKKARSAARSIESRLTEFGAATDLKIVSDVTLDRIQDYINHLRQLGKSDKTILDRLSVLRAFLRWAKHAPNLVTEASGDMNLRVATREVRVYKTEEIAALFAASSADENLLWQTFISSGLRDAEMAYLSWDDVNFERGTLHVREKPDVEFTIKDREERQVPMPADLIVKLKARRLLFPADRWVFPTSFGKPDLHFIRRLKRLAHRAGLNCGYCTGRNGASCKTDPTCKKWQLHSFRRTAATFWNRGGIDPHTIKEWLGHSDLETTLLYLKAEDMQNPTVRAKVDAAYTRLLAA